MAASDSSTDPTSGYYASVANGQQGVPPGYQIDPTTGQVVPATGNPSLGGQIAAGATVGGVNNPNGGATAGTPGTTGGQGASFGVATAPTAPTDGSGVSGGGAPGGGLFDPSLYAPFTGTPPSFITPTLPNAPQWNTPPAFNYADFQAPSLAEAQNQPGYQFGLQQGEQALQQSQAAQGLLRTGGTLKDILSYGQNAANQNYSNVLNQDLGIYNTNRAGAVQQYNTNYQTQYVDPYQAQVLPYQTNAANAQHQADAQNAFNQNSYTTAADLWFNNQNSDFSKYLSLAQLGAANA